LEIRDEVVERAALQGDLSFDQRRRPSIHSTL
jgi:hypothetical protein